MTNSSANSQPRETPGSNPPAAAPTRAKNHRLNLVEALAELTRDLNDRNTPMEQVTTLKMNQNTQGWLATITFKDSSSVDWALAYIPEAHATSFSLPLPPPDQARRNHQKDNTGNEQKQLI